MSQRRVKIAAEGEVDGEAHGTGAGSEKSSDDEMRANGINKRAK